MKPIYTQTTLESLTTAQVKDIAKSIGAITEGDKRIKQTWIDAVLSHQTKFSPVKVAAMEAHIETVMNRLEPIPAETEAIDTYVPTPPTRADDEAFAAAMGLTYDDVFGESIEPTTPIEVPQQTTPLLIPLLSIALVVLMSIAIVPALVLVSIIVTLGQTQRGTTPHPQPIGSSS
ncbi:MAG: hypothetical protein ACRCU2_30825 [Planktothrix sp.]